MRGCGRVPQWAQNRLLKSKTTLNSDATLSQHTQYGQPPTHYLDCAMEMTLDAPAIRVQDPSAC